MAVTGWLENLRAAEKTALLQDGNSSPPIPPPARAPCSFPPGSSPPCWRPLDGLSPKGKAGRSQPPARASSAFADEETEAHIDEATGTAFSEHPSFLHTTSLRSAFCY